MNDTPAQKMTLWAVTLAMIAIANFLISCSAPQTLQSSNPLKDIQKKDHIFHTMDMGGMDHQSMNLGPVDADFDLRFIDGMSLHHEGAISMANTARQSKRPELQTFATQITRSQSAEVAEMTQWRKSWHPKASHQLMTWSSEQGQTVVMSPQQKQEMAMSPNLGVADADFDLRFLNAMIPHHEGAVKMAIAAQKSKRPEIQKLAARIIASQQNEIQQMKRWQKAWSSHG